MAKARRILFRIFYSTTFTVVFLILLAFICISPIDTLYQSYHRHRLIDIFLITGVYVVTGIIAALIYASRLYTNRSVLRDIPKTYMPIDVGDLPTRRSWKFISETLARSAIIAYEAKPRSKRIEEELPNAPARISALLKPELAKSQEDIKYTPDWGIIAHRGWSSPVATDLPDLEYSTVVAELTDLVEAKAVSLAPIDPMSTPAPDGIPTPDERIIEILTRPDNAGMRKYLAQLSELDVIPINDLTTSFITLYERSRFGPEPLLDIEFQSLMRMFAEVLRSMQPVNPNLLDLDTDSIDNENNSNNKSYNSEHVKTNGMSTDKQSLTHSGSTTSLTTTTTTPSVTGSVRHRLPRRMSEDSVPSLATDDDVQSIHTEPPSQPEPRRPRPTQRTNMTRPFASISSSRPSQQYQQQQQQQLHRNSIDIITSHRQNNISQTSLASSSRSIRTRSDIDGDPNRNRRSMSIRSTRSNTGSVVIRLNDETTGPGVLPYTIEIPGRGSV